MTRERYSRQTATGLVSEAEQKVLARKTVAVVGLGAIGSVSAELIVRSGVKNIILIDRDFVEESNLQRQQYSEKDLGYTKAGAMKAKISEIDSKAKIASHVLDLDPSNISVLKKADLILDGTDNLYTRFLINDFAQKNSIPWIYAAAIRTLGATMNILPLEVCFSCVFNKDTDPASLETCETAGIITSASVAVASLQVAEALKILLQKKDVNKCLVYLDIWSMDLKKILVNKNPSCPTCSGSYHYLRERAVQTTTMCGKGVYQVKPKRERFINLEKLRMRFHKFGINYMPGVLHVNMGGVKVSVFSDGRAIVRGAKTKEHAHAIYARAVGE